MTRITLALSLIHLLFLCVSTFGQNQDRVGIEGVFQDGVYKNEALGFELTIPAKWHVAEKEERDAAADAGRKEFKTGNKAADAVIDKSKNTESLTMMVSKKPVGAIQNAAFGFSLTKEPSELVTPKMVAEGSKSVFLASPKITLVKDVSIVNISGHQFATFDMDIDSAMGKQHLRVFTAMVKQYALTFALTYWDNDDDLRVMEDSLKTIKFTQK